MLYDICMYWYIMYSRLDNMYLDSHPVLCTTAFFS